MKWQLLFKIRRKLVNQVALIGFCNVTKIGLMISAMGTRTKRRRQTKKKERGEDVSSTIDDG